MRLAGFVMLVEVLLSFSANAIEPKISVSAQQRYPWNGLVDVVFTVEGEVGKKYEISFIANDLVGKTNLVMSTWLNDDGIALPASNIISPGNYRWAWDAASDLPDGFACDRVTVTGMVMESMGGVQLWDDGPYWAECNVGASKPEDCGYYFRWGETIGYKRVGSTWKTVNGSGSCILDVSNYTLWDKDVANLKTLGYIDSTGNLVAAHDAAAVHNGLPWRMPTSAELSTLESKCTTTWTMRNGVYGRIVTGKGAYVSKSIFLPAAGYGYLSDLCNLGSFGYCWSSTPSSGNYTSTLAWDLAFGSGIFSVSYLGCREFATSVRPIRGFVK